MSTRHDFVATCSRGTEPPLCWELSALGLEGVEDRGAVRFRGKLEDGYRVCLHSRVASRVLLVVGAFDCPSADALYDGVRALPWADHISPHGTLAVSFVGMSDDLRHSQFAARRTKDAIVDRIRDDRGARPDVDLKNPDVRVHVHLRQARASISIDLAGVPLHERGSARQAREAPLKENLAAACLHLAGWPAIAARGGPFVDPMCGSGTLLSEAAGMALGIPAGRRRKSWGFDGWLGHEGSTWNDLLRQADDARKPSRLVAWGSDTDPRALSAAGRNLKAVGLASAVQLSRVPVGRAHPPDAELADAPRGLLLTNPPYGERLGTEEELKPVYAELGDVLRRHFTGWHTAVLTGSRTLAGCIGLRASRRHEVYNGPIECRLLEIPIRDAQPTSERGPGWRKA